MCTVHALTNGIYNSQYTSILCSLCLPPKVEVFSTLWGKSAEKKNKLQSKQSLNEPSLENFLTISNARLHARIALQHYNRLAEDLSYT